MTLNFWSQSQRARRFMRRTGPHLRFTMRLRVAIALLWVPTFVAALASHQGRRAAWTAAPAGFRHPRCTAESRVCVRAGATTVTTFTIPEDAEPTDPRKNCSEQHTNPGW